MKVWRICRANRAATAFSGEGSRLFAARWNPAGVPMVYTATSLSLAVVETFVHMDPSEEPENMVSVEATLPIEESAVERIDPAMLPKHWRELDVPELQALGEAWVRSKRSLALMVPSAAVEGEWNVLVNPKHRNAAKIRLEKPLPFQFDPRMFRARR